MNVNLGGGGGDFIGSKHADNGTNVKNLIIKKISSKYEKQITITMKNILYLWLYSTTVLYTCIYVYIKNSKRHFKVQWNTNKHVYLLTEFL